MNCSRWEDHIENHSLDFCLYCGRIHDSVADENCLAQQKKPLARPSGEPDYQDDQVHLGAESFIRRAA